MNEKAVLYTIIGVLAGILVGIFIASGSVRARNYPMMNMMGMGRFAEEESCPMMEGVGVGHMDESMNKMMNDLQNVEGGNFDREFTERMIDHHRGAIDMAELALDKSSRKEIKDLSEEIISAQNEEINMMENWMKDWSE